MVGLGGGWLGFYCWVILEVFGCVLGCVGVGVCFYGVGCFLVWWNGVLLCFRVVGGGWVAGVGVSGWVMFCGCGGGSVWVRGISIWGFCVEVVDLDRFRLVIGGAGVGGVGV